MASTLPEGALEHGLERSLAASDHDALIQLVLVGTSLAISLKRMADDLHEISTSAGRDVEIFFGGARCSICGCTDDDPCEGGCGWSEHTLCDNPECVKKAGVGA